MPIEIKELYIKINVDPEASTKRQPNTGEDGQDTAAIIAICIEEVMEKLKELKER